MNIGPIQIRWTKTVKSEQAQAQRLDRCIAGQHHDIQALRGTVELWRPIIAMVEQQRAKTPKAGVASL